MDEESNVSQASHVEIPVHNDDTTDPPSHDDDAGAAGAALKPQSPVFFRVMQCEMLDEEGGRYTKAVDSALPGDHTKTIYDRLTPRQTSILIQLRTGHTQLKSYLFNKGLTDTEKCEFVITFEGYMQP